MFQQAADFFSKLIKHTEKKSLSKEFMENSFLWATETVPHFTQLYFQNLWNGSKRLRYKGTFREMTGKMDARDANFLDNWWITIFQSSLILIALISSIFFLLNHSLNRLMAPVIDKVKALFKGYPNISLLISFSKSFGIISGLLLSTMVLFFLPKAVISVLSTFIAKGVIIAFFAPIVFYGLFSLKLFNNEINALQNETPYIGHKNVMTLVLCTFFSWITPVNINVLFAKTAVFVGKKVVSFSVKTWFQEKLFTFNTQARNEALKSRIKILLEDVRTFIADNLRIYFDNDLFDLIKNYVEKTTVEEASQIESRLQRGKESLARKLGAQLSYAGGDEPEEPDCWVGGLLNASNNYFSQYNPAKIPEPSAAPLDSLPRDTAESRPKL